MRFRQAAFEDMDLIATWRWDIVDWIRLQGSDQWNQTGLSREEFKKRITRSIRAGETWLALDNSDNPVGTIAVDLVPDAGLWTPEELAESYIIHRMMVPRSHAGQGIGAAMVEFADEIARKHGRRKLVLDAWDTNKRLHRYYQSLGFRYVRTVQNHWTPSATLFERLVSNFDPNVTRPDIQPIEFRDEGR